ncbi:MAG: hypothetical protein BWY11_00004 [Firmicutes bacterium ADurb.Bin182]|nr:MAG: hypothetical protein BWY11_00004 [Firmicutes bacterium ADurb.Bin182]
MADLIHAEQEPEIFTLGIDILLDFLNKLLDAHIHVFFTVEPVKRSGFAHTKNALQNGHNVVLKKCVGGAVFYPWCPVDFLKRCAEGFCLALLVYETFQFRYFQVLAVKAEVVVEHLGEHAQNRSFVFVNGSLDIDVKENRLCRDIRATYDCGIHHRVIELALEEVHGVLPRDLLIGQQIG